MNRGQSTTVATVFLVAVVLVVGGSIAYSANGVVTDAQRDPVSAAVTADVDGRNVTVTHESGDELAAADVDLVLGSEDGTTRLSMDGATQRGDGDGTLTAGETFVVGHGLTGETATVSVVHRPSGSVLARDEVEVPVVGTVPDPSAAVTGYSAGGQDGGGSLTVSDGTYRLEGNTWKEVDFDYTVTADTVLVVEFESTDQGELHAVGLGTDNQGAQPLYKLYGTQDAADTGAYNFDGRYATYTDGDGWVRYEIPVGEAFQGDVSKLVFVNDDDSGGSVVSRYRNVRVEER
jgi:FlaG/FlaF family flagellin (archaellin)